MSHITPKTLFDQDQENPLAMFMYALEAPESKKQYPKRLKVFLDFLTSKNELSSSDLENQCRGLLPDQRQIQNGLTRNLWILFYIRRNDSIKKKLFMGL